MGTRHGHGTAIYLGAQSCGVFSETCTYVFRGTPFFFVLLYNTVPAFEPNSPEAITGGKNAPRELRAQYCLHSISDFFSYPPEKKNSSPPKILLLLLQKYKKILLPIDAFDFFVLLAYVCVCVCVCLCVCVCVCV